jgi:UDP-glucose 4-epimerase
VVLRPSVVYGPGQSSRMLIAMVMHALAAGETIAVTQGEQTRDFLYVDDLADAIVLALTTPGMEGGTYNIGSGEIVSVRQCLELIEHITGCTGLIEHGARPYPVSERFHYEPMLEKTYEVLPWKASVMLEEGLRRTWKSIRNMS